MSDIKGFFFEHDYDHAKDVFGPEEVAALRHDFGGTVSQFTASGEGSDATWHGGETNNIARKGDMTLLTHNVPKYSRTWLNAFLNPGVFDVAEATLGPRIIHVSDATEETSCISLRPGSHRLDRVEGAERRRQNDVIDQYPIKAALPVACKAGDKVFFHSFTLHGSMPNRSDRTHKTVLCQIYDGHGHVEPGSPHADEWMVLRDWNHTISRHATGQAA